MNLQGQRDLIILSELERDGAVTQRSLATKLGIALGLTNLYLKRLARKGYVKITTIPSHRIRYLLTPQGFAEKSRLTYHYMQYSLSHYREMRARLRELLSQFTDGAGGRVVIFGTNEMAELAYLSLREKDLVLVGFIADGQAKTFLAYPVSGPEALAHWDFDAVLLTDLDRLSEQREVLRQCQVPDGKVLAVGPLA